MFDGFPTCFDLNEITDFKKLIYNMYNNYKYYKDLTDKYCIGTGKEIIISKILGGNK
jgi:hypothetical protein